ncbi:MAG: hypothetical protein AB7H80_17215 [Candidatus Kapaibacterium sp.]
MKTILKEFFFCVILLLTISLSSSTAQGQIDQYVVLIPTHTTSGEYSGDYDLKGTKVYSDGYVRWGAGTPKPISEMQVREYDPSAIPDGSGGMFVCYTIEHTDEENGGDRDIVMRHLDSEGADLWDDSISGAVVLLAQSEHLEVHPHLIPSADGAIVLYEVEYISGSYKGEVDVAAVRVDGNGKLVWENAIWVANSDRHERIVDTWSDGYGNAIALIQRNNNSDKGSFSGDLVAVKISSEGITGWGGAKGNLVVVAGSPHSEENPAVVPDGQGGAFIAYELHYTSGARAGDVDLIAQHLTVNGDRLWLDPENPPVVSSNPRARELSPSITADSSGITVAFEMVFNDEKGKENPLRVVAVQRMDQNGYRVWNGGDKPQVILAKNRGVEKPIAVSDRNGGTYIVMEGVDSATGDRDIFAQYLDKNGKRSWGKEGYSLPVFFGPMPESNACATVDSYGGLIVVAVEGITYRLESTKSNDSTIIAQRMNSKGEATWGGSDANLILSRCQVGEYKLKLVRTK